MLPIDYANACPDVAVTSLHYYFPWAMKSLVKWTAFCAATGRRAKLQVDSEPWFAVADDPALDYGAKLAALPAAGRPALRQGALPRLLRRGAAGSRRAGAGVGQPPPDFDRMLGETITATYPEHEQDRFTAHFRGLIDLWIGDEQSRLAVSPT